MPFEIDNVKCIHHTMNGDGSIKALKVTGPFFGPDMFQWIPDFAVTDDSEVWKKNTKGTLFVTNKFAEKKGWL